VDHATDILVVELKPDGQAVTVRLYPRTVKVCGWAKEMRGKWEPTGSEMASWERVHSGEPEKTCSCPLRLVLVRAPRRCCAHGAWQRELLFEYAGTDIARRDLLRLDPGAWLSDESINLYMRLLQVRAVEG
jgi:hypothetical protein